MNAIIAPYTAGFEWCDEFFPEKSLCSMPLAGKPLAEHLLDLCTVFGAERALVLDYNLDLAFRRRLESQEHRWPLQISYEGASLCPDVQALAGRNAAFIGESETLIFRGPILPQTGTLAEIFAHLEDCIPGQSSADGLFLYSRGSLKRYTGHLRRISSLKEYFDLNFSLLASPAPYTLPGYSAENGVYTGMNVSIKQNCSIEPPVMLSDNIRLERDCTLRNGVIIGEDSLIDRGTVLEHTIVLDDTYVGYEMEFKDKIVSGGRIIDVENDIYVDQEEIGVSSKMKTLRGLDFTALTERILLLFLALLLLVPYLVLALFGKHFRESVWGRKFSMDRYPKIWDALLHRGLLVRRSARDRHYVFCASDAWSVAASPEQQTIDDLYFSHHATIPAVLRITFAGFLLRGLS